MQISNEPMKLVSFWWIFKTLDVDNMFIINIKMWVVNEIKDTLSSKFELKDLGEVDYYLGIVVKRNWW